MTETRTREQGLRERIANLEGKAERYRLVAAHEQEPNQPELNAIRSLLVETGNVYGTDEQAANELYYRADEDVRSLRDQLALLEAERDAAEDSPALRCEQVRERAQEELNTVRQNIARLEHQRASMCYASFEPAGYSEERIEGVEAAMQVARLRERRAQAALSECQRREGTE